MATALKSITEQAKELHARATQQKLAASDASHPMRSQHSASTLAADADREFRNMGQTLVPELLRELDEARRLLDQRTLTNWDAREMRAVIDLAHEHGWNGVENSKLLSVFMRDLVQSLRFKADEALVKKTMPVKNALAMLREWWSENKDLRYAEVSHGRKADVMVTLWQIDHVTAEDVKVGHGEGETLEEALQRAQGVIIL